EIRGQVKPTNTQYDLDGDGRTNIAVFRQSANTVFTLDNITNNIIANSFGSGAGDNWLPTADFDGDGRSDPILVKIEQTRGDGFHSILQTGSNTIRTVQWGNFLNTNVERLAYGDYDGDGRQDIAVFRSGTGVWYILESSTNTGRAVPNFGAPGDSPSVGDYDKDGKTDLCVVRNVGGQLVWYILNSSNGQMRTVPFGANGDSFFFFFPFDFDGDGAQDIAVARSVGGNRVYYILQSSNNQVFALQWGLATDTRSVGDYDGDGKTDIVARRIVSGQLVWYIYQTSNGQGRAVTFGQTGDQNLAEPVGLPVSSDEISEF
ncbi:MAG: VCBS repeat-containing protein, partial [Acidobacteriota bacterium]|nr:VCBS repeat-containing protein [Acidobacteriota bacterium]